MVPTFRSPLRLLLLAIVASGGCNCDPTDLGRTLPPGSVVNTFAQAQVSRIDILWIVDNSNSMVEEQQNLSDNLLAFFGVLDRGEVDYHIAVTTTDAVGDAGRFVGDPAVLSPDVSGVLDAFKRNVLVGIGGRAREQGFQAALEAFERQPEFLRDDAYLFVIFVSDEDDHSFGELRYYWRTFEQLKGIGNDGTVSLHGIIGPPNDPETGEGGGCQTERGLAAAGDRYAALAAETGGIWASICDADFSTALEALGNEAVGLTRKFPLTETPDPDTIEVYLHFPCEADPENLERGLCFEPENQCDASDPAQRDFWCTPPKGAPDGWVYEAETNSVFFDGKSVPALKSTVEIIYQPPRPGLER